MDGSGGFDWGTRGGGSVGHWEVRELDRVGWTRGGPRSWLLFQGKVGAYVVGWSGARRVGAGRVCGTFCWVVWVRRSETKRRVSLICIATAAEQQRRGER